MLWDGVDKADGISKSINSLSNSALLTLVKVKDQTSISSSINYRRVLCRVKRAVMEMELDIPGPRREEKGPIHRNGRAISRKMKRRRLVDKRGRIRMNYVNVPGRGQLYYLSDQFTTLIEARWRYVILIFSLAFIVSWLVFGSIWWGIYSYRLKYHNIMCIEKVNSWTSAFLFSLETQTTIGYGGRQITPDCPEGVICLLIQCIIGLLISSTMLGLIFAKLSRPHRRRNTILFSRHAVIGPRDGKLFLMFRIADLRKKQLIEANIRVYFIRRHVTSEGEEIGCFRRTLPVTYDNDDIDDEKIFLFAPVILLHEINEDSPFYNYSANDLLFKDFEVVVLLEGIVEPTGMTMQARTSYVGEEIHWGHLFVGIMTYKNTSFGDGHYSVDISRFHETFQVDLPRESAREFYESRGDGNARENGQENSQQQELEETSENTNITDATQSSAHGGVSLIPNGDVVGKQVAVTKL